MSSQVEKRWFEAIRVKLDASIGSLSQIVTRCQSFELDQLIPQCIANLPALTEQIKELLTQWQARISRLDVLLTSLEAEKQSLQNEKQSLQNEKANLKEAKEAYQVAKAAIDLSAQASAQQPSAAALQSELDRSRIAHSQCDATIARLQEELRGKEREVEEARGSAIGFDQANQRLIRSTEYDKERFHAIHAADRRGLAQVTAQMDSLTVHDAELKEIRDLCETVVSQQKQAHQDQRNDIRRELDVVYGHLDRYLHDVRSVVDSVRNPTDHPQTEKSGVRAEIWAAAADSLAIPEDNQVNDPAAQMETAQQNDNADAMDVDTITAILPALIAFPAVDKWASVDFGGDQALEAEMRSRFTDWSHEQMRAKFDEICTWSTRSLPIRRCLLGFCDMVKQRRANVIRKEFEADQSSSCAHSLDDGHVCIRLLFAEGIDMKRPTPTAPGQIRYLATLRK